MRRSVRGDLASECKFHPDHRIRGAPSHTGGGGRGCQPMKQGESLSN